MSGLSVWIYAYKYMNEQFFCGQKPQTLTSEEVKERLSDLYSLQLLRMRETDMPRNRLHNAGSLERSERMSDGQARAHWFAGIEYGSIYSSDFNPDRIDTPKVDCCEPGEPKKENKLHSVASTTWSKINTFIHRSTADDG